jgi:hypothetical protein
VCHKPLLNSGSMDRYALEMYARERYSNSMPDAPSRKLSMSAAPLLGFFSRNASRPNDYQSEPPTDDAMTFIYELRCDFVDIDEILPMIK